MHGLNRPIARPLAPSASRRPKFSVQHGVELVDEYAWLRADNWQEVMRDPSVLDTEIRTYLEAENAYTEAALADTLELQQALFAEMKARIKEDDSSVPAPDGPYEYFMSYVTGGQYPRLCRRPRGGGPEEILLDGNAEASRASPTGSSAPPRTAPTTSCWPMPLTTRAPSCSPSASATWPPARTCPTSSRHAQRHRLVGRQPLPVLRAPRRQPAAAVRLPAPRRHGRQRGCADLRGEGYRLLRRRRPDPVQPLHHHRCARPPDHRGLPDRCRALRKRRRGWWRRASTATSTPSSITASG